MRAEPTRHVADEPQAVLQATGDVGDFLRWLVAIAVRTIGGDISVAVTVMRDGQPVTAASSERDIAAYDQMQYGHDEGPCQSAIRADRVVLIQDLARDERFSGYRTRALARGVRSTLSIPLRGSAVAVGALTLYARHPRAFGHKQRAEAQRFADDASFALDLAARRADDEILDRLATRPRPGSAARLTRPQPTSAVGATALEATTLESLCWCNSHGGV
jgi:GAF domain-containing protein